MVIFASNGPGTERPTPERIRLLKECDEVTTYSECGWFCAVGWKRNSYGEVRKEIGLHFNSHDEYLSMTGQGPRRGGYDPDDGYDANGEGMSPFRR